MRADLLREWPIQTDNAKTILGPSAFRNSKCYVSAGEYHRTQNDKELRSADHRWVQPSGDGICSQYLGVPLGPKSCLHSGGSTGGDRSFRNHLCQGLKNDSFIVSELMAILKFHLQLKFFICDFGRQKFE